MTASGETSVWTAHALLPQGWAHDVILRWNDSGVLTDVQPGVAFPGGVRRLSGPVIPGMPNLHSHAFQRGFSGLTEYRAEAADSFWSWRELMYRFASRITPKQMEDTATWLYVEMLEAGYTSVCEFHYLHHDVDGRAYAEPAEMALALLRAANRAGIGMTLLPVLYQTSGFGAKPPGEGQRRFIHSTDAMLQLLECLRAPCDIHGAQLGIAPHSLRAVPPEALREAVSGLDAMRPGSPVHIHIAEQTKEVDDCLAWSGQRPVQWLLEHADVDSRWCLIHATHMTPQETVAAARTGAVAGLCPSTEANLGDGIFDMPNWREGHGRWGIGSDSHATVNAAEDLMLLEYSQRLALRRRNVMAESREPNVATAMTLAAVAGGARAAGRAVDGLVVGQRADFVVLDEQHVALQGLASPQEMLSAHVFASHRTSAIKHVWTGGVRRVSECGHALHGEAQAAFVAARHALVKS